MRKRAVQPQQAREQYHDPQKAARHLLNVELASRLGKRGAVHHEHEQGIQAHGRDHFLGVQLLGEVFAQERLVMRPG